MRALLPARAVSINPPSDKLVCKLMQLAIRAAQSLNASTGGYGLSMSNPVQRAWRDANAVSRHISLNWDAAGTRAGQSALGLEPKGQY